MATVEMKLKPFPVPDAAVVDLGPGRKEDGVQRLPTIPVEELSANAVEDLAFEWLSALYASRGERCPFNRPVRSL